MSENEKQYVWVVFEEEGYESSCLRIDSIHSNEDSADKKRRALELESKEDIFRYPIFFAEKIEVVTQ